MPRRAGLACAQPLIRAADVSFNMLSIDGDTAQRYRFAYGQRSGEEQTHAAVARLRKFRTSTDQSLCLSG